MATIPKAILTLIFIIFGSTYLSSQNLDIGVFTGYGNDNITDFLSRYFDLRIGDNLKGPQYGVILTYNSDNLYIGRSPRYSLIFKLNPKGTISKVDPNNKIEFNTTQIGLKVGYEVEVDVPLILYLDVGVFYNLINEMDFYSGNLSQSDAFPFLDTELEIKSNEVAYGFNLGMEYRITRKVKATFEFARELGITQINETEGEHLTRGSYFNFGFKITIYENKDINKHKGNPDLYY